MSERHLQLDGLRALAVLTVIAQHAGVFPSAVDEWLPGGLAVSLFFVLSGFLITGILVRARDDATEYTLASILEGRVFARERDRAGLLKRFYARRALRILPLYVVAVATLYALGNRDVHRYFTAYATATVNMIPFFHKLGFWLPDFGARHFWSLSVEEQFYLVWPLLVLFTPRRNLLLLAIGTVLVGLAFRLSTIADTQEMQRWQYVSAIHCDELGIGAVAAVCGAPRGVDALVAYAVFWATHGTASETFLGPLAWAVVCAWIVGRANRGSWRALESRPLVYLGTISYGLYVWHWPVQWLLPRILGCAPPHGAGLFALVLASTVAVASASWYAIEKPILSLKDRVPYARRAP